jgi:hypothetical protein
MRGGSVEQSQGERSVKLEGEVDCPIAAALDYAADFFKQFEQPKRNVISLRLRALGLPFPGALKHSVYVRFGIHGDVTEQGRAHDEIAFSWFATVPLLPDFHGVVRARMAPQMHTTFTIEGRYRPPLGAFGALFDAVIGRHVALATLHGILADLIAQTAAQHQTFCAVHEASPREEASLL